MLLVILHKVDLRSESKVDWAGLFQQGADRNVCRISRALRDEHRMIRALCAEIVHKLSVARLTSSHRAISAPSMAGPSSSGAPKRIASLEDTWMKSANIGCLEASPTGVTSSHFSR